MSDHRRPDPRSGNHVPIAAGEDQYGEHRGLGVSRIDFKVCGRGPDGILIMENTFKRKGGPPRHSHHSQQEWFYTVEGDFLIEVGAQRYDLGAGDSILAPRRVPHVWAFIGDGIGRMLICFAPAGQMEGFFREVTKANAMPPEDPTLWRRYGMELEGPPLAIG